MNTKLLITPKTRIRELIDSYPELEDELVAMAPAFKKLKNPVLRNTVARVTSISQAALIGDKDVNEMVNELRQAVGQERFSDESNLKNTYMNEQPDWLSSEKIAATLDARPMLEAGHHPVSEVFEGLGKLKPGEILKLITGFMPVPLLDKAKDKDYQVYSVENSKKVFFSYFYKP